MAILKIGTRSKGKKYKGRKKGLTDHEIERLMIMCPDFANYMMEKVRERKRYTEGIPPVWSKALRFDCRYPPILTKKALSNINKRQSEIAEVLKTRALKGTGNLKDLINESKTYFSNNPKQTGYKADQIIIEECAKINGIGVKEMLEDLEGKIPKKGVESILISTPKKWIKYKNTKKGLKKDPTTIKVGSLTAGIPHAGKYFDFRNLKPVKPTKSRTVKRG